MALLDGKLISDIFKKKIKEESSNFFFYKHRKPHLAALLIGNNPASEVYVASKIRSCEEVGFISTLKRFDNEVDEKTVLELISNWNLDPHIDGILVQVPLPYHIKEESITEAISPKKDVDGFHPNNLGRMIKNLPTYISATPLGILKLMEAYKLETLGKHCVVLGRSHNVGSPISILMSRPSYPGNCTVTLCHSKTHNLNEILIQADILIVAVGSPELIRGEMLKSGVIIIDVGMNRVKDLTRKSGTRLVGDVHFESAEKIASYITPVPGGVGLMTIIGLLENTLLAAKGDIYG